MLCASKQMCFMVQIWRLEDNFDEGVLSFLSFMDWIEFIIPKGKHTQGKAYYTLKLYTQWKGSEEDMDLGIKEDKKENKT